jgi:polyhydroxybutyrate depolymerase
MKSIVIFLFLIFFESCTLSQNKDIQIDNRILKIDFKDRYYGLFVNQFCQHKNSKCPILFAFHGGGGEALKLDITTELVKLADQKNVVIVYPNASNKHWNDGRPEVNSQVEDLEFIDSVFAHINQKYSIDKKRVCATGISNGGLFSFRLACERSEIFSSVMPIAANMGLEKSKKCNPKKSISILNIMGDEDPLIPFNGGDIKGPLGLKKLGKVLSSFDTFEFWKKQLSCSSQTRSELAKVTKDGTSIEEIKSSKCKDGIQLTQVVVHGGGHTWPGGRAVLSERLVGKTSNNFNASEKLINFCLSNPKK